MRALDTENSKVLRVVHIIGGMNRAGAETFIINMHRSICREQVQFDYICFSNTKYDYEDEIDILGGRIFRISTRLYFIRLIKLWILFIRQNWQIVHCHTLLSSGLFLLVAKLAGIANRITHSHSAEYPNKRTIFGYLYYHLMITLIDFVSTDFVACGKLAADFLYPHKKYVKIFNNSIDVKSYSEADYYSARQILNIKNKLVIIQIGRLVPVKNHVFTIDVARELVKRGCDFKILVVGVGECYSKIKALINEYNLESYFDFMGIRDDIVNLLAGSDVLIMPSIYEGFPLVLVESQASGIPALVSNTISDEVDFGLGLVQFLDINGSPVLWANKIIDSKNRNSTLPKHRLDKIVNMGFDCNNTAMHLSKFYRQMS